MKILLIHNYYKQPGGEDVVVEAETLLLRESLHEVRLYEANSAEITNGNWSVAHRSLWSQSDYNAIRREIMEYKPDVVHIHNIFPLISTSAFKAVRSAGVALVHTLHNYRPFCLNGVLYRDEHICTDCLGRNVLPGIKHKCYKGSRLLSAGAALAGRFQLMSGWLEDVDVFITSSNFAKMINIDSGIPADKIMVKPNPTLISPETLDFEYIPPEPVFLFVGRLDARKGIKTVLAAAEHAPYNVRIIGDGDLRQEIEKEIFDKRLQNVKLIGWRSREEVASEMRQATALIVASEFYESFGNVIVEAFSCGLPVISTDIGAQSSLIEDGITGFIFKAGDSVDLTNKMREIAENALTWREMRRTIKNEYQIKYSTTANVKLLLSIYAEAISRNEGRYK